VSDFFSWDGDDLIINCHIQANAKNTAIVGLHGHSLKIRIAALPSGGKANLALTAYLAAQFGVRKNEVALLSGHTNKNKRVKIYHPQKIPDSLSEFLF